MSVRIDLTSLVVIGLSGRSASFLTWDTSMLRWMRNFSLVVGGGMVLQSVVVLLTCASGGLVSGADGVVEIDDGG